MRFARPRQRGVMLALVMMVMALLGGILAALTTCSAGWHRERQLERVRRSARLVTNCCVSYARMHLRAWQTHPPDNPVRLDVAALLAPHMASSAQVSVDASGTERVCRISVRVERYGVVVADTVELALD